VNSKAGSIVNIKLNLVKIKLTLVKIKLTLVKIKLTLVKIKLTLVKIKLTLGGVGFYRIERRVRTLEGQQTEDWGAWQATTTDTQISLTGLERGVEHDFRILATNATGDSLPSPADAGWALLAQGRRVGRSRTPGWGQLRPPFRGR
jgi:hypothetical protein